MRYEAILNGCLSAFQRNGDMSTRAVKKKTAVTKVETTDKVSPAQNEPNAESLEALAELEAGELTRYADTADMFKKLGIKGGKA